MSPTPNQILAIQERKIKRLEQMLTQVSGDVSGMQGSIHDYQKRIELYKQAMDFRTAVKSVAEAVLPFHQIINVTITAATTRVTQVLHTSAAGWFFADRVFGSFRPTAGANAGRWRPIASSDPVVASWAGAADVLDFTWEYYEDRTNRARQNDARVIPGDLLFRRDGDGLLLGGDPWAPATDITVAITPLVAPDNEGVFTFVFLGEQCINVGTGFLEKWLQAKRDVGLL